MVTEYILHRDKKVFFFNHEEELNSSKILILTSSFTCTLQLPYSIRFTHFFLHPRNTSFPEPPSPPKKTQLDLFYYNTFFKKSLICFPSILSNFTTF